MPSKRLEGIDLNLMVALDALLAEANVTRAAARLGVTQPAMSHSLQRLRALFDDPLLVRTSKGMVPTARAQQLVEPIRAALSQLQRALEESDRFDPATTRRTFTVAALDYAAFVLLPAVMDHLAAHAPGIQLVVRAVLTDVAGLLEAGELDLSIGVANEEAPGLYQQQLFKERFVCLVRKDHPKVKKALSLAQYLELPHLVISPRGSPGSLLDDALAREGRSRRIVHSVPHFLVAPHVVARTDLLLTMAERVARTFAELLPLRVLELPLALEGFTMRQHWHARRHADPAHIWLRATVAELARAV